MVRRVRGALIPPFGGSRIRRADLYRTLRDAMLKGTLSEGDRLPSTRELASEYRISRTTVETVYEQLASEGLIERGVGRGSFVTNLRRDLQEPRRMRRTVMRPSRRGQTLAASDQCREPVKIEPFNAGVPDVDLFPARLWERCQHQSSRRMARGLFNYCDTCGYQPLRDSLSRYIAQFRGIRVDAEQVMIFSSTSQAMTALFLLLLDPGDRIWMEDPGYPAAVAATRLTGVKAVPIPVDESGINVDAGRLLAPNARIAYVTPAHQYPTGVRMAQQRRHALLDWAIANNAIVIEDDYDADFRYQGEPLTTLHALDGGQRVVYLATLSKTMFLALRVAFAVVPKDLIEPLANVRAQLDTFPPIATQAALSLFIDEGHLAAHVRHMRRVYADKLSCLLDAIEPMVRAGWVPGPASAGLHFVLYEPARGEARRVARASGLSLKTLSDYALDPLPRDGLSIRFGGLSKEQITSGAARLRAAIKSPSKVLPAARTNPQPSRAS